VVLVLHVSVSRPLLLTLAAAAQLGQHVLKVFQTDDVGVVGQLHCVGHRVDVHLVHAMERPETILDTAGAIGSHVFFESQGNASFLHVPLLKSALQQSKDQQSAIN
jgi:hypothetical protein